MTRLTPKQVGEVLAARQARSLEKERPQKAEVSGTGTGISNRGTTGQIRATLSNGTTIWVDAGGNLAELTAGDIIWVERIGVGTRSEWRMVDWFSDSVGNRVPAGRSDVFNAKVSEIWAADGDPIALDTDNSGNMQILTSIDMDGKELILDEDGDTSIQADSDDVIDINVAGVEIGSLYGIGMLLGRPYDYYAMADGYPLFDRLVNWGRTPDDHWINGGDELSWTGWAAYTGYATPDTITHPTSRKVVSNTDITKAFYYRSYVNAQTTLYSRLAVSVLARAGLMVDDGVDAEDGEGADNFYRVMLESPSSTENWRFVTEYRTGGGAVTTTNYFTLNPATFYGLCLLYGYGTRWTEWGGAAFFFGEPGQTSLFQWLGSAAWSWTPARIGLYFENLAAGVDQRALFDWYEES